MSKGGFYTICLESLLNLITSMFVTYGTLRIRNHMSKHSKYMGISYLRHGGKSCMVVGGKTDMVGVVGGDGFVR